MASVSVWYDREGDFLEVIFEETPAVMDEMQEDIYERRSPDGRIVGFAVLNFSKHDRDKLTLPLEITATAPSE
jgi:uncharacterized protein YuzE